MLHECIVEGRQNNESLIERVRELLPEYDMIFVDGSDCVGKSSVIRKLVGAFPGLVRHYRPDYKLWEALAFPLRYRWAICFAMLDWMSQGAIGRWDKDTVRPCVTIVDRSALTGMVYNMPTGWQKEKFFDIYVDALERSTLRVLHIIVSPDSEESYKRFIATRYPTKSENLLTQHYIEWHAVDSKFRRIWENPLFSSRLDLLLYENSAQDSLDTSTCETCPHCDLYGFCQNEKAPNYLFHTLFQKKCEHTEDKEVQDIVALR